MHIDAFIHRFSAGLGVIAERPLPEARRAYDILCRTFAPPDPIGMQIENSTLTGSGSLGGLSVYTADGTRRSTRPIAASRHGQRLAALLPRAQARFQWLKECVNNHQSIKS